MSNFNENPNAPVSYLLEGMAQWYKTLKPLFERCFLKKINRAENFVAHNAAKWARLHSMEGELDISSMHEGIFSDSVEWFPD